VTSFARNIRPHIELEFAAAATSEAAGDAAGAFAHLERAHILGQPSTIEHVRVHWRMFLWGWRQRSPHECFGQIYRLIGAATKTFIGFVPSGNTGGANVSPVRPMPVPPELARIIENAQRPG
jgi:hypothetical protein